MSDRHATYTNEQQRAQEFQVGDPVVQWGKSIEQSGRVVKVWPAIGQVDVEYPWGNVREAVIDLQLIDADTWVITPQHANVPGGEDTVEVSGGPASKVARRRPSAERVVNAYQKKAIYWFQSGRRYKVKKNERDSGSYHCPKCPESTLSKKPYKRDEGISMKMLVCPTCTFVIREDDLEGVTPFNKRHEPAPPVLPQGHNQMIRLLRPGKMASE
jgi:hypothetical protein